MATEHLELDIDAAVLRDARNLAQARGQDFDTWVTDALVAHQKRSTNPCPTFDDAMDEVVNQHADLLSRLAK